MPLSCTTVSGWAYGEWGAVSWGGSAVGSPGGPLPSLPPFDIFCLCGDAMIFSIDYDGVTATPAIDFSVDVPTATLSMTSPADGSDAFLEFQVPVPDHWTLEEVVTFDHLPAGFSSVSTDHIFIGGADNAGPAAGLFFSQIGIAYGGSYNGAYQILPASSGIVTEGVPYVIRIAVSTTMGAVFVYITSVADALLYGQKLQFILPLIPYSSLPPGTLEGANVHVMGTATTVQATFQSICMATGVLIANLPPIADAGTDQAARMCSIIRFDGSASFDPEGQPITYKWRLIDAPIASSFTFSGLDGTTHPVSPTPTGFANKVYSSGFTGASPIPVDIGDVLFINGQAFDIIAGPNLDGFGWYVQIPTYSLPDSLTNVAYKVIKQNGISGPTTVTPTFFPDVPGFYKFDLTVFDGSLFSDPPAVVVVNVLENVLPRGCIPDMKFMWSYLSDFWDLLEDRERIETVWSSMAQICASELYTLWQIEYSKSLRDVQRTFVRRWLHYDLLLREPFLELTSIRTVWRGIDSNAMPDSGVGIVSSTQAVFTVPGFDLPATVSVPAGAYLPKELAALFDQQLKTFDSRFTVTAVSACPGWSVIRIYAPFSFSVDPSSPMTFAFSDNFPLSGMGSLVNQYCFDTSISLLGLDIKPDDPLTVLLPDGTPISVRIAGIVDNPTDLLRFQRLNLKDPLPLGVGSRWFVPAKATSTQIDFHNGLVTFGDYCAIEVVDNYGSAVSYFRDRVLGTLEAIPNCILFQFSPVASVGDISWYFGNSDRFSMYFWGAYRRGYMPVESVITDIPYLQRVIKNPDENEVLRRNVDFYIEEFRGQKCIRFERKVWSNDPITNAPILLPRLWAEYNYLDNRPTIESNFGIPAEFTLDDLAQLGTSVDYLSAVRGLWYSFLNGPTMFDLRAGTQILLGLPFAEEVSIIDEIRADYSPNQGRLLLHDKANPEVVRSYTYPVVLAIETNPSTGLPYAVGDEVKQFAPLVTGAEVIDWVKNPEWIQGYINQNTYYEVEKFHRFVVRVDSAAFKLSALLFVRSFILKIKPKYTFPMFVVLAKLGDSEVSVTDDPHYIAHLELFDGIPYKELTVGTSNPGQLSMATMFDQPDASPGVDPPPGGTPTAYTGELTSRWRNAFDTNSDNGDAFPTFPTPDAFITWGFDRSGISPDHPTFTYVAPAPTDPSNYPFTPPTFGTGGGGLAPDHSPVGRLTESLPGPYPPFDTYTGTPPFDGIFRFDGDPVFPTSLDDLFIIEQKYITAIPSLTGLIIDREYTATNGVTVTGVDLYIGGVPTAGSDVFFLAILVNNALAWAQPIFHTGDGQMWAWHSYVIPALPVDTPANMSSFVISPGDSVQVLLVSPFGDMRPFLNTVLVTFGAGVPWSFDDGVGPYPPAFPGGTYVSTRPM